MIWRVSQSPCDQPTDGLEVVPALRAAQELLLVGEVLDPQRFTRFHDRTELRSRRAIPTTIPPLVPMDSTCYHLDMESELAAVVLGALIAGGVSLATFMLAARSERKRASAEQRRFEATRADQLRATLVDERRKLLDSSSLLFVKLDETTSLVFGQDGQSQTNPHWRRTSKGVRKF